MRFFLSFALGFLFFISAFLTLGDYGISWDEPTHFKRGQAYLWFLLTGENDYQKLPAYDLFRAQNDPTYHQRSIYQDDKNDAYFYKTIDGTHPPLADILAATTNMVFYQKLGWLGDVESYHLFEIFVASLGVSILFLFVYEGFGLIAALFSTLLYATYPLFWAESHFNIKDPIETTWIIITLYFLWKGIKSSRVVFVILSAIFAGFALGTKLNVIFLPFIIVPWSLFILKTHQEQFIAFLKSRKTIFALFLYPIIVFAVFYASYPFLWDNPIANIGKVLTYYQRNALDPAFANAALSNFPFYAFRWFILTAPPLVLIGLLLNIVSIKNNLIRQHGFLLLISSWFFVTIARVSVPGVNIYGGVRQIMEYIPALAILAGVGLYLSISNISKVRDLKLKGWKFKIIFILVFGIWSLVPIIRLHPNENVYFNFLAGGLKGAVESGFPAAGNSFGNAYHQGIRWINANAAPDAKLTIIQGSSVNIPKYKLRSDIDISNDHFSGINRGGEYLIGLIYNYEHRENFYAWEYLDKFLKPIFEVKVDSVSILKIWKNDWENTKPEYKLREEVVENTVIKKGKNKIEIEMENEVLLSSINLIFKSTENCSLPADSVIETSLNGKDWVREKDPLTFSQVGKRPSTFRPAWESLASQTLYSNKPIIFYFAGRKANFVRIDLDNEISFCMLNDPDFEIKSLVSTTQNET